MCNRGYKAQTQQLQFAIDEIVAKDIYNPFAIERERDKSMDRSTCLYLSSRLKEPQHHSYSRIYQWLHYLKVRWKLDNSFPSGGFEHQTPDAFCASKAPTRTVLMAPLRVVPTKYCATRLVA